MAITLLEARRASLVEDAWREVYHNASTRVVSFLRRDARITVYYAHGTVATMLFNQDRGRTQLIRPGTELNVLKKLFLNPRFHTTIRYDEYLNKERVFERQIPDHVSDIIDCEYSAISSQVKNLDEEYIQVRAHRDRLVAQLQLLRVVREQEAKISPVENLKRPIAKEEVELVIDVDEKNVLAEKRRQKEKERRKAEEEKERKRKEEAEMFKRQAEIEKRKEEERLKEERKRKLDSERRELELRVVREAEKQREQVAKRQRYERNAQVKSELVPHDANGSRSSRNEANMGRKVKMRTKQEHEMQPSYGIASASAPAPKLDETNRQKLTNEELQVRGRYLAHNIPELDEFVKMAVQNLHSIEWITTTVPMGILYLNLDGSVKWSRKEHLPPAVRSALSGNCGMGRLVVVLLGFGQRYFAMDESGKFVVTPSMRQVVKGKRISILAFGMRGQSYFVKFCDGTMTWRGVPIQLSNLLQLALDSLELDVEFLSLGSNGQFFVRFFNAQWHAGGLHESDDTFLRSLSGDIRQVAFTPNGLIVRYNPV